MKSSAAHVNNLAPGFTKSTRRALLPSFASITKKGTSADDVNVLLDTHEDQVLESARIDRERKRAARAAFNVKAEAAKTSSKKSYKKKRQKTVDC
jgi:hypothetical protein